MAKKKTSFEERYKMILNIIEISEIVVSASKILTKDEKLTILGHHKIDREELEEFLEMRSTPGLKQLEMELLTPWNETYDGDSEKFWKIAKERGLEVERIDYMDKILKRGRIASFSEYEFLMDAIVIYEQENKISREEVGKLNKMLGDFEKRHG